jgi:hypothetical protein
LMSTKDELSIKSQPMATAHHSPSTFLIFREKAEKWENFHLWGFVRRNKLNNKNYHST